MGITHVVEGVLTFGATWHVGTSASVNIPLPMGVDPADYNYALSDFDVFDPDLAWELGPVLSSDGSHVTISGTLNFGANVSHIKVSYRLVFTNATPPAVESADTEWPT